jgi:hypothetical protein
MRVILATMGVVWGRAFTSLKPRPDVDEPIHVLIHRDALQANADVSKYTTTDGPR